MGLRHEQFQSDAPGRLEGRLWGIGHLFPAPLRRNWSIPRLWSLASWLLNVPGGTGRSRAAAPECVSADPSVPEREGGLQQIEGTVTRLDQLLLYEAQPDNKPTDPDDVQEVVNYVRALDYGLERMKSLPLCSRLLCEIHERLMSGVRGERNDPDSCGTVPSSSAIRDRPSRPRDLYHRLTRSWFR